MPRIQHAVVPLHGLYHGPRIDLPEVRERIDDALHAVDRTDERHANTRAVGAQRRVGDAVLAALGARAVLIVARHTDLQAIWPLGALVVHGNYLLVPGRSRQRVAFVALGRPDILRALMQLARDHPIVGARTRATPTLSAPNHCAFWTVAPTSRHHSPDLVKLGGMTNAEGEARCEHGSEEHARVYGWHDHAGSHACDYVNHDGEGPYETANAGRRPLSP